MREGCVFVLDGRTEVRYVRDMNNDSQPYDDADRIAYDREKHTLCLHCDAPVCREPACICGLPKAVDVDDGGYWICPGPDCIEQTVADSAPIVDEEDITSPARLDADKGDGYDAQMLRAFRGMAVRP